MTEFLGRGFLWLMGVEMPPNGEGLHWELAGSWQWNRDLVFALCLFAIFSGIYVVVFYFRERSRATSGARLLLAAIRLAVMGLVLLVMVFQLQLRFTRMQLPSIAVLVDRSASMRVVDDYRDGEVSASVRSALDSGSDAQISRWDIARQMLRPESLDGLMERYSVRLFTIARSAEELTGSAPESSKEGSAGSQLAESIKITVPDGQSSRLGTSLQTVLAELRGQRTAAVLILSDGITTEGVSLADAAEVARSQAVPLYVVGIGTDQRARQLVLSDLVVDEIVFVNDYVDFDFKVTSYGLEGQPIELVLQDAAGKQLNRAEVLGGKDGVANDVTLSDRPTEIGQRAYRIEATIPGVELQDAPAPLTRTIEVRDDPVKVLLVQDAPSFEFKYLKHLLERDQTIDLRVVLQQADIEYPEQDQFALPLFPVSREKLFQYDVLILGDVDFDRLSRRDMENIVAFVEQKGGGLLVSSGNNFSAADYLKSPLAKLLPFESLGEPSIGPVSGQIRPTPIGMGSPHMQLGDDVGQTDLLWQRLPAVYGINAMSKLKPTARVLAETESPTQGEGATIPVFVVNYVPPGKVLWHATDETYRWRYRLGDALYARYWIQAIRYLSRAKLLGEKGMELSTDKLEYDGGEPIKLQVRFFDERLIPEADDGVVVLIEGEGVQKRVVLQRNASHRSIFEGSVGRLPIGSYEALLAPAGFSKQPLPVAFQVTASVGEMTHTEMDRQQLQQTANRSRGQYFDVRRRNDVFSALPRGESFPLATLPPVPLWNNWRIFVLILALLLLEWLLRKRLGMV